MKERSSTLFIEGKKTRKLKNNATVNSYMLWHILTKEKPWDWVTHLFPSTSGSFDSILIADKLPLSWEREMLQQSSEQSDEDRSIKSKYPFMTQQSRSSSWDLRRWKGSAKIRRRRWIDLLGRTPRLKLPFLPRRPRPPANFLSTFALFLCSCVRMGRTRPAWQWADG